ncbi:MAG: hybrid sensor histidine kinase/response regulator [Deltaproteobacteria bacterium]|nr:MAG: hybrid sensor histidine kinase/response regulator [Deltaproteobacteria bacterium]
MDEKSFAVALQNCSQDPIQFINQIQSFGALIGFDIESNQIHYLSNNIVEIVGASVSLGQTLSDAFPDREFMHAIRGALSIPSIAEQRESLGTFSLGSQPCEAFLHSVEHIGVLEIEPAQPSTKAQLSESITTVRTMLGVIGTSSSQDDMMQTAVKTLRNLTGFDRVMGYRFLENGDGEVVAEAKSPSLEPFLGLRYPSYDIPPQVRTIATKVPYRIIVDTQGSHVSVTSNVEEPLDLSRSVMRGVSPVHLEYLANMGVRASMSLSIQVHGQLWGLFAFHHRRPRKLSSSQIFVCELFSQLFSAQTQQKMEQKMIVQRQRIQSIRSAVLDISNESSLSQIFDHVAQDIMKIVEIDGIALLQGQLVNAHGDVPSYNILMKLTEHIENETFVVDSLRSVASFVDDDLGTTAGVLAICLDKSSQTALCFFRNEIRHNIRWGGEPEKIIKDGPSGPRLHPRKSFSEYIVSVSGKCERWLQETLTAAQEIRLMLIEFGFRNYSSSKKLWLQQEKQNDLLVAELNHRVKNILALVQSISKQTQSNTSNLQDFLLSFERRISALVVAHDLSSQNGMRWVSLYDLIVAELKPFKSREQSVRLSGPRIGLYSNVSPTLALVIHELVSNSAKHGALSLPDGKLNIEWSIASSGLFLHWKESGVYDAQRPKRQGFGLSLIERAIPYECGGRSKVDFLPTGMEVELWLPSQHIFRLKETEFIKVESNPNREIQLLSVSSLLLVEDSMVIAMGMEKVLMEVGCQKITSVPTVELALEALNARDFEVAVLDIHLGEETSLGLVSELKKRSIPFFFLSGYDTTFKLPDGLDSIPRLRKPIKVSDLVNTLATLLGQE